jgi:lysyl-tRNA synthetase class 2
VLTVTCHRLADLDDHTRELIKIKADQWRDGTVERGFSMTLGRCGSPEDGCTVVAMSTDNHGELRGLLHFVPWRDNGLWLDLMRRDRTAENGVAEQLVAGVIRDATRLGITQVSLNFAVFCSVFARRRTARSRARSAALARRASQPVQVLADRVAVPSQREVPARMAPLICF